MDKKKELYRKIYNISFYILTFLLGFLFILFAYTIYFKGKEMLINDPTYQIYTKEIVGKYLSYLLIPFILWIGLVIGGYALSIIYPTKKKNIKIDSIHAYNRLKKTTIIDEHKEKDLYDIIMNERKKRKIMLLIVSFISLICMIYPAIYLFNVNNFPGNNINQEISKMALTIIPFIALSFILFIIYFILFKKSLDIEINNLKNCSNKTNTNKYYHSSKFYDSPLFAKIVQSSILIISVLFIILGIFNGGVKDVLTKAINICTECIGLA